MSRTKMLLITGWLVLLVVSFIPPTKAQSLSAGCENLNSKNFDQLYVSSTALTLPYNAGEQGAWSATTPQSGSATGIVVTQDGAVVGSAGFPGSVTYTVPASGTYSLSWSSNDSNVTWKVVCRGGKLVFIIVGADHCPVFFDGRINSCDTFNPVVLYGKNNGNEEWGLDIYAADGTGLLASIPPETINAVERCPATNSLIYEDTARQILFYQLATCQFFLRAPMNEAGKWYIIVFNELYPNAYYQSWTEFSGG